jgi:hypothetical protein
MKFEQAFSTIREFGGRMKRLSYPEVDYFIDKNDNILMTYDHYENLADDERIDEAHIWGKDLMEEDWEVDINSCWKD